MAAILDTSIWPDRAVKSKSVELKMKQNSKA